MQFRRKLYIRGSSLETTIPKPLLFSLDLTKKHTVVFTYDEFSRRWYLEFEERTGGGNGKETGRNRSVPKRERFQIHTY